MTDGTGKPLEGVSPDGRLGLIGGIGLTEVTVYTQHAAPDGQFSGCPHVHAVTDEAYYVLRGAGWAEFHDVRMGYRRVELAVGDYVHFPPGVVHRLVSGVGDGLVILGIMGNAGMAERGEARVYFGPEVDADEAEYARLMALPRTSGLAGALERRDRAVRGYMGLMELLQRDEPAYRAEIARFCGVHRAAMAGRAEVWREQVRQGPLAWARATLDRIDRLAEPGWSGDGADVAANPANSEAALGMCGTLRPMLKLTRLG